MGFGFDLNNLKVEVAKAAENEKAAIREYLVRIRNSYAEGATAALEKEREILDDAIQDPRLSVQAFVLLCMQLFM